jgi:hypothetical protein
MQISVAGQIDTLLSATNDVDYAMWGPYASTSAARTACGSLPAPTDCSFSDSVSETPTIPSTAAVGEVYVLLFTNYANAAQDVTFSRTGGTGYTDCSVIQGCGGMRPMCASGGTFAAEVGLTAESGNNYGCLSSQANPAWYYMKITRAGQIDTLLSATNDVDYAVWGPYSSHSAATTACGSLPAPTDCSFSASVSETPTIASPAAVGEIYILLFTNYANVAQNVVYSRTGGVGETDCSIISGCRGMSPICSGGASFAAITGTTAEGGNNYGCLSSPANPAWFYLQISVAGQIDTLLSGTNDVDYAMWGPYTSTSAARQACGSLPAPTDCSYSSSVSETPTIPSTAAVGEVYVLLFTNHANVTQSVTFSRTGGTGYTDCSIIQGCGGMRPMCANSASFAAEVGLSAEGGNNYGCLSSQARHGSTWRSAWQGR